MQKLTDESPMPFGKFKGSLMANVPAKHLLWLSGQKSGLPVSDDFKMVCEYVAENIDVIELEVEIEQRNNDNE